MSGAHESVELHEHIVHTAHESHGSESGHEEHSSHAAPSTFNKKVALLISILAALLSLEEIGGNAAQNDYLAKNIEVSDTWNFFQAKNIRSTVLDSSVVQLNSLAALPGMPADIQQTLHKTSADWHAYSSKMQSDPVGGEGLKELAVKAKGLEKQRDHSLAAYHSYEYASGASQLAIVLASAAAVTATPAVAALALGLGIVSAALAIIAKIDPELIHHEEEARAS